MKDNYLPTSNPSGVVKAPLETRYFVQVKSRQGKSCGNWIFLKNKNGYLDKSVAETYLKMYQHINHDDQFRIWPAEVFVKP